MDVEHSNSVAKRDQNSVCSTEIREMVFRVITIKRKDGANQLRVSFDPFGGISAHLWTLAFALCPLRRKQNCVREDWYQDFLLRCENQPNQFDASFDDQIFMETEVGPGAMSTT